MNRTGNTRVVGLLILAVFCFCGCAKQDTAMPETAPMAATKAVAVLHATEGNMAHGVVTFSKEEGGVHVVANLMDVPAGEHGFHVHEFGDCSSADGSAAGGHFNPEGMAHGGPMAEARHIGDLGNITADSSGNAQLDYVDNRIVLSGSNSIIGHGLILHAQPDDLASQPTGNAGARIACGVIGVGKP